MTREKIKYYLYIYNRINSLIEESKKKIDEYNLQIKTINETYFSIGSCVNDGMPRNQSPFTDKILLQIERKDQEIEKLKKLICRESEKINEYIKMYNVISKVLQEVTERQRNLVKEYYFNKRSKIEVCYFIGCSTRTFARDNLALLEDIEREVKEK